MQSALALAIRNLLHDKTRFGLSVLGVALAVALILVLNGFLDGLYRQITSYLDHSPASILVAQEDVSNLLGANSLLPAGMASKTRMIRDVVDAIPILSQFVILDLHGKKQPAYMVGYEPDEGGGPWELASGREPRTDREVVLDRVLAQRHGLEIGNPVEVLGRDLTIVGLSNGTTSWMTSFFFVRKRTAEELMLAPGATSFLLLTIADGADPAEIVRRLNRLSGINALAKSEVAANDLRLFAKVFSGPLELMVGIAFLVGTMIVGLVIYTITVERRREYGVMKAIGASIEMLYRVVMIQATAAALLGTTAGILMSYGISQWIMSARPQFVIILDTSRVGWSVAAGFGMAAVSALFPVRVLARLAPAEVFRK